MAQETEDERRARLKAEADAADRAALTEIGAAANRVRADVARMTALAQGMIHAGAPAHLHSLVGGGLDATLAQSLHLIERGVGELTAQIDARRPAED